jgi:hypothetical protein
VSDIDVAPLVWRSGEGSEGGSGDRVSPGPKPSPLSRWLVVGGGVVGVVLVAVAVLAVVVRHRARRRRHATAAGVGRDKARAVTASHRRDGDDGLRVHDAAVQLPVGGDRHAGGVAAPASGRVVMYRLSDVLEGSTSTGSSRRGIDASAVVDAAALARNDTSATDGAQVDLDRVRVARERLRSPAVTVKRSDSSASSEQPRTSAAQLAVDCDSGSPCDGLGGGAVAGGDHVTCDLVDGSASGSSEEGSPTHAGGDASRSGGGGRRCSRRVSGWSPDFGLDRSRGLSGSLALFASPRPAQSPRSHRTASRCDVVRGIFTGSSRFSTSLSDGSSAVPASPIRRSGHVHSVASSSSVDGPSPILVVSVGDVQQAIGACDVGAGFDPASQTSTASGAGGRLRGVVDTVGSQGEADWEHAAAAVAVGMSAMTVESRSASVTEPQWCVAGSVLSAVMDADGFVIGEPLESRSPALMRSRGSEAVESAPRVLMNVRDSDAVSHRWRCDVAAADDHDCSPGSVGSRQHAPSASLESGAVQVGADGCVVVDVPAEYDDEAASGPVGPMSPRAADSRRRWHSRRDRRIDDAVPAVSMRRAEPSASLSLPLRPLPLQSDDSGRERGVTQLIPTVSAFGVVARPPCQPPPPAAQSR